MGLAGRPGLPPDSGGCCRRGGGRGVPARPADPDGVHGAFRLRAGRARLLPDPHLDRRTGGEPCHRQGHGGRRWPLRSPERRRDHPLSHHRQSHGPAGPAHLLHDAPPGDHGADGDPARRRHLHRRGDRAAFGGLRRRRRQRCLEVRKPGRDGGGAPRHRRALRLGCGEMRGL